MAGRIEIRVSGAKFRYVVLNRSGERIVQSGPFDDKASAKRGATSLQRALDGAEVVDVTKAPAKPAPARTKK